MLPHCVVLPVCERISAGGSRNACLLLRGTFNVSTRLDALAGKLAQRGIAAKVYGHGDEVAIASDAIRDYRSGKTRSLVLIGHSLGAGAAVSVARRLDEAVVPVALLISLDPVASGTVPGNVRRAVSFHVSAGGALTAEPGFRGDLSNVNVSGFAGMDHMSIQAADSMHQTIMGYIR